MLTTFWNWLHRDVGRSALSVTSDDGMEFLHYKGGAIKGKFFLRPEAMAALEKRGEKMSASYRLARRRMLDTQHAELQALNKKHMDALAELERGQRKAVMTLFAEHLSWLGGPLGGADMARAA